MYGSYGSYSSTSPMEIPSRRGGYQHSYLDDSCAFPSWPRRSSLGEGGRDDQPRATSYISDEDLEFLSEPVFPDEDAHSISSYGSGTPSPQLLAPVRHISEEALEEMRREQALRQQELIRVVMDEKDRRRQAAKAQKQRKPSSSKKGASPKSKLSAMTPIAEAAE
ncbi:hypothetical protein VMCG_07408 [Cytospora schulzeri]|uniref:Uncharacterized protein n=1 Tax=Cytospora schulzeri TaxID=448051 RepID=A0A423W309_9PEZI|nr:hypothetical protein VMCG_07408 [Valsa malicola]